jgi:hypothetical protein
VALRPFVTVHGQEDLVTSDNPDWEGSFTPAMKLSGTLCDGNAISIDLLLVDYFAAPVIVEK